MENKRSWARTLAVQVLLCVALYCALNLGQPQKPFYRSQTGNSRPLDVYFVSVRGGYRNLEQQIHLLKQARKLFPSRNVPWYTTRASMDGKVSCFQEQINVTHGIALNIIGVDTGSLQDLMLRESISILENDQLNLLARTLEETTYNWSIVFGYRPVVVCEDNKKQMEAKQVCEQLHHIFIKYGVNAYVSTQGCTNLTHYGGVAYIGIPEPFEAEPCLSCVNGGLHFQKGTKNDGFLLHRVGSLDLTTYFVSAEGEVVSRSASRQRGKDVM